MLTQQILSHEKAHWGGEGISSSCPGKGRVHLPPATQPRGSERRLWQPSPAQEIKPKS